LNIGTNDLAQAGATAAAAPDRLVALVEQLRQLAPTAQIVVGGLPPSAWSPNGSPQITALNAAGQRSATADPTWVQYVPVFERLKAAGFDPAAGQGTSDGTHFSVAGGAQYGSVLEAEVIEALQRTRRC
jgi:lysophospholipase L1-like esterase